MRLEQTQPDAVGTNITLEKSDGLELTMYIKVLTLPKQPGVGNLQVDWLGLQVLTDLRVYMPEHQDRGDLPCAHQGKNGSGPCG